MSRKATFKLSKRLRMNQLVVPLILLSIAVFFPSDVQAACPPQNNCESCSPDGRCITCRTNYGYQNRTGYCEPCGLHCLECSPIGGNCTACNVKDGYGPDFKSGNASCGLCLQDNCDAGCSEYGAGTCDRCNDGYGPNPATINCTKCIEHCISCPVSTSQCGTCEFGYAVFDPGNKSCGVCSKYCTIAGCFYKGPGNCDKCDPGYVYFRNTTICGVCAANCSSCEVNGAGQCDNCTFGYGLTPNNTCEPCSAHCTQHGCNITGARKCDDCDFGYGLLTNRSCDKCSDNCTKFGCNTTGAHNCTKCDPGFGLFPDGSCGECAPNCSSCVVKGAGKCDNCTFGYGLTPNDTCAPCSKYCNTTGCVIEGAGECDKCDSGYIYFRSNKTCGECAANCSSCVIRGAGQCDNCTFGYGLTPINTCAPCSAHCTQHGCNITGAKKCDECDIGYGLLQPNGSCDNCAPNCSSCTVRGAGKCDNCTFGYGLTPTNTCEPCAPNCPKCSDPSKCEECATGFVLIIPNNTCAMITTAPMPTTVPTPATTSSNGALMTSALMTPTLTAPGSTGSTIRNGNGGDGGNNYTTAPNTNGSGGGGGGGDGSTTLTTISLIDVSGSTTQNPGWNSNFTTSGLTQNPASPSGSNFPPTDEIDWRILLTLLMLVLGGIFVTIVSVLCWSSRFYLDADGDIRRQRRRIYLLKES